MCTVGVLNLNKINIQQVLNFMFNVKNKKSDFS